MPVRRVVGNFLPRVMEVVAVFSSWWTSDGSSDGRTGPGTALYFTVATSDQTRLPAEFKHIIRRRKRN